MQWELKRLLEEYLTEKGLSRREFVLRLGYRNINKGMRYLMGWLRCEELPNSEQTEWLVRALGQDRAEFEALIERDRVARLDRARHRRAQDRRFYLTIRYMPAVYVSEILGEDLDEQTTVDACAARAAAIGRRCCLNTPSNRSYWLSETGELEGVTEGGVPVMRIGNKEFNLCNKRSGLSAASCSEQ